MRTTWLGRVSGRDDAEPRWVRVVTDGAAPAGDDVVEEIATPSGHDPFAMLSVVPGGLRCALADVTVAVPVRPSKILCVGRNYRAHAEEMGNAVPTEPLLFFKPPSALVASDQPVVRPAGYERVDMEAELVAVIGRRARSVAIDQALQHVAGYTLGNDVSNRDLQRRDGQWTRAKGFDTFAPLGPFVRLTAPDQSVPGTARVQGLIDGELRQDAPLSAMVFDVATIVAHISACMTLEPGDVVYTGTPAGVSELKPGHVASVTVFGWALGELRNPVVG
jgi:2-keto-4-pentenoate hydratase/2-oxohepta-3-ene-1,7-dioic acid hydratase in catechol pathway